MNSSLNSLAGLEVSKNLLSVSLKYLGQDKYFLPLVLLRVTGEIKDAKLPSRVNENNINPFMPVAPKHNIT